MRKVGGVRALQCAVGKLLPRELRNGIAEYLLLFREAEVHGNDKIRVCPHSSAVNVTPTPNGIELYFPPLRNLTSAVALGAFGVIATALGSIGAIALVPGATSTSGLMSSVLLAAFVLPFAMFGAVFVLIALYMALNGLIVRVTPQGITSIRTLFGVALVKHHMQKIDLAAIEPQIASRDQSPFTPEAVFRLVALDRARVRRVIVAESLNGESIMEDVKAMIEQAAGRTPNKEQA